VLEPPPLPPEPEDVDELVESVVLGVVLELAPDDADVLAPAPPSRGPS
jgi:hypothetical protein